MGLYKRLEMARNVQTSLDELAQLARDEHWEVRKEVAGNPHTPIQVLIRLACDKDRDVREAVAGNAQTPPEVLSQLALDKHWWVRAAVARNPRAPARVLSQLVRDVHWGVRLELATNPRTPVEATNRLAQEAENWQLLRSKILAGLSKRSLASLCQLAAQASPALAQLLVEYHKENPLPLQVLQAGMKGNQSELFRQALDRSSSLYVLKEAFSLLHKEPER